jgi:hypothetical protein
MRPQLLYATNPFQPGRISCFDRIGNPSLQRVGRWAGQGRHGGMIQIGPPLGHRHCGAESPAGFFEL